MVVLGLGGHGVYIYYTTREVTEAIRNGNLKG